MSKKKRKSKNKENSNIKTKEERISQIEFINKKLLKVQLDDRFPEIQELHKIMNDYIENGESNSGKMPLSNSNKDIHYIFSTRANVDCQVNLMVRQ